MHKEYIVKNRGIAKPYFDRHASIDSFLSTDDFSGIQVMPYQYENFNNIVMILNIVNPSQEGRLSTLKFYLINATDIIESKFKLLVTYNLEDVQKVDSTILNRVEKEQGVNNYDDQTIMGIQFKIKNKMLETNNIY